MTRDWTTLCEARVLPVIMAFGFGVLAMDIARDHRESPAVEQVVLARLDQALDYCTPTERRGSVTILAWTDAGRLTCTRIEADGDRARRSVIAAPVMSMPLVRGDAP